jgi:hypothetical protein
MAAKATRARAPKKTTHRSRRDILSLLRRLGITAVGRGRPAKERRPPGTAGAHPPYYFGGLLAQSRPQLCVLPLKLLILPLKLSILPDQKSLTR